MGASARAAVSGALLSADLCSSYAVNVGVSVFLLVSVFLGDCCLGPARNRLSQIEDLTWQSKRGPAWQGLLMLPTAWERRDDAPAAFRRVVLREGVACGLSCGSFGSRSSTDR